MSFREELAPYLNQRLKCVGVYESQSTVGAVGRPIIKTALFNEIKVETPKGEELDFDHLWVQFAEDICNTKPKRGDVIEFTAVVNNYHHQARNCEAYGLTKARDVVTEADKEVYRTPLLPPPPERKPEYPEPTVNCAQLTVEPTITLDSVRVVKKFLKDSPFQVESLIHLIDHYAAIEGVVSEVGGIENLKSIIEVLL